MLLKPQENLRTRALLRHRTIATAIASQTTVGPGWQEEASLEQNTTTSMIMPILMTTMTVTAVAMQTMKQDPPTTITTDGDSREDEALMPMRSFLL